MSLKEETSNKCYLVETGHAWVNNDGTKGFKRNLFIPDSLTDKLSVYFNHTGVFKTVYRYETKDQENSPLYGDFYLDFDSIGDYSQVRTDALMAVSYLHTGYKVPLDDIKIYFSGQKGLHITVPAIVLDIEPTKILNVIYKELAIDVKKLTPNKSVDTQIYDNKRLFRVPNTKHEVTGLYKIPLTFKELREMNSDEIKELAKNKRILESKIHKKCPGTANLMKKLIEKVELKINAPVLTGENGAMGVLNVTPPCISNLLENGATEGHRNNSVAVLTSFFRRKGLSFDETIAELTDWNNKLNKQLHNREVEKTARSIYKSEKTYGCSTLEIVSVCDKKNCPLMKRRSK